MKTETLTDLELFNFFSNFIKKNGSKLTNYLSGGNLYYITGTYCLNFNNNFFKLVDYEHNVLLEICLFWQDKNIYLNQNIRDKNDITIYDRENCFNYILDIYYDMVEYNNEIT